jgi:tRNA-uridine 2-sulfurtransferase
LRETAGGQYRLVVAEGADHPGLLSGGLLADQAHWIAGEPPQREFDCVAKTRYRQADQACHVQVNGEGYCRVTFREPQRAVTPGQSIVFYQGELCLGGAIVQQRLTLNAPEDAA